MKKSKVKMIIVCNKCGKVLQPDSEKSNANWRSFDLKTPCKCGGIFRARFIDESKRSE